MEQRSGNSSRRLLVLGLFAVFGFSGASMLVVWSLMREPPMSVRVTPPQAAPGPATIGPGPVVASQEPPSATQSVALPVAPQFIVTPLFDASARYERGRSAVLIFRVDRLPSGLASGLELSMSVFDVDARKEAQLQVRETGEGVYQAGFDARTAGRYALSATVPGAVAQLSPPVVLVVVERVVETAAEPLPGGSGGRASFLRSPRGDLGGGSTRRGR